ncbi:MAG: hypothetical protein EB127_31010, partial [Alphaproteobacteria bacterium]|nr:hypothetical protein [Alphaproteobacteria bacterium]
MFIDDTDVKLIGNLNYLNSLYEKSTITRFIETYLEILKQFASLRSDNNRQETRRINNLNYLSLEHHDLLVNIWNRTEKAYPSDKTIHQLFEEQVEKTPDSIAVICEDQRLTYRELNEKANQLAHYIRKNHDIRPDTLIVLCLDRSEYILVAILGVLKAGGAYVPMDTSYPDERVRYILKDTEACLILTNEVHKERIEKIIKIDTDDTSLVGQQINREIKVLPIDSKELGEELFLQLTTNLKTETVSNDLAYVIYTSGTTGNPKGVMIEHKGVVNLKYDLTSRYGLGDKDSDEVILQFSNYVFDASVEQIVLSILNGFALLFIPYQLWLDKNKFYDFLNVNRVTHIDSTPSFLEQYDFTKI